MQGIDLFVRPAENLAVHAHGILHRSLLSVAYGAVESDDVALAGYSVSKTGPRDLSTGARTSPKSFAEVVGPSACGNNILEPPAALPDPERICPFALNGLFEKVGYFATGFLSVVYRHFDRLFGACGDVLSCILCRALG